MKTMRITTTKAICDLCGEDYTERGEQGGILFNKTFVCPECLTSFAPRIKQYNEEHYVRAIAINGETFFRFVNRIRNYNYNTLN